MAHGGHLVGQEPSQGDVEYGADLYFNNDVAEVLTCGEQDIIDLTVYLHDSSANLDTVMHRQVIKRPAGGEKQAVGTITVDDHTYTLFADVVQSVTHQGYAVGLWIE
jgi:hypothetical protein